MRPFYVKSILFFYAIPLSSHVTRSLTKMSNFSRVSFARGLVDEGNWRGDLIATLAPVPRNQLRTARLPGSTTPFCYYYTQNQSKVSIYLRHAYPVRVQARTQPRLPTGRWLIDGAFQLAIPHNVICLITH